MPRVAPHNFSSGPSRPPAAPLAPSQLSFAVLRRTSRFFAACCMVLCAALAGCATKPADPDASERRQRAEADAPAAFTLEIEAPKEVRELLELHF